MEKRVAPRVDPYRFFKTLFGFSEKSVEAVYERISVEEAENGDVTVVSPGGQYRAGRFRVLSVDELREEAAQLPPATKRGTFSLICGNGIRSRNFADIDVGAIQMNPVNRGALFQVASNFNALEFISSSDRASRGITKYCSDHTQGPAASISCAPATLYRNYFVRHIVNGLEVGAFVSYVCLISSFRLLSSTAVNWRSKSACCATCLLCRSKTAM